MNEVLKLGIHSKSVGIIQQALCLYQDNIFGPLTEEAVKDFQRRHGLTPDGIVGELTWAALHSAKIRSQRTINEIIVHCTATPEGMDYTVDDIRRWHKARGWSDIGYHYVVYRDGSIHSGRPEAIVGAHCEGHNMRSLGVCYVGGVDNIPNIAASMQPAKDTRTPEQRASLKKLLRLLKNKYPSATIRGHRDFAKKACPSFDATSEYKNP